LRLAKDPADLAAPGFLVPYRLLSIAILFFCCIGVYSLNNSANEVLFIAFFGVVGYLLMKLDCEPAPLLMGFLLGPMMEVYMRCAMLLSRAATRWYSLPGR
jgi:TctA family transporter